MVEFRPSVVGKQLASVRFEIVVGRPLGVSLLNPRCTRSVRKGCKKGGIACKPEKEIRDKRAKALNDQGLLTRKERQTGCLGTDVEPLRAWGVGILQGGCRFSTPWMEQIGG